MGDGTGVVTGASSGIGEQYARALAARGHDLVLVARRRERLTALADELREGHDVAVEVLVADLANRADIDSVGRRVAADDVVLLVNNAGLSGYGPTSEADPDVLAQVVELNALAPTLLTRAALRGMLARDDGAIINVASLLAFSGALPPDPLPWRATYAGTKAHVVAFTRVLAAELGDDTHVRLQVCCPGYTQSEFHITSGAEPVADGAAPEEDPRAMPAEDVVRASLRALELGEVVCVPGLDDPGALAALAAAEAALRAGSRRALASRYRD
jgi:hypothetical protein